MALRKIGGLTVYKGNGEMGQDKGNDKPQGIWSLTCRMADGKEILYNRLVKMVMI